MIVLLTNNQKMYRLNLPENINGTFWITDKLKRIMKIECVDGNFQVVNDEYAQILKSKDIKIENGYAVVNPTHNLEPLTVVLKHLGRYAVLLQGSSEISFLYCFNGNMDDFVHLDIITESVITVGSSVDNSIVYKNVFMPNINAEIFKEDGTWFIRNTSSNNPVFVNDVDIDNNIRELNNGDVVFMMGLMMIYINESFYINYSNNVILSSLQFKVSKVKNVELEKDSVSTDKIDKEDYYSRSPRMFNVIESEIVKIDEPPKAREDKSKPIALILASSLSMGIISIVFSIMSIRNSKTNGSSTFETFIYIIIAIITFFSMLVIPIINIKFDQKTKLLYEKKRQQRYKDYLKKKFRVINDIKDKQRKILYKNYLSAQDCEKLILNDSHRIWERKFEDDDFLSVRIGIGDVPLEIEISYPQEKFEMEDDNLLEMLHKMVERSQNIPKAPIGLSLKDQNLSAIISKDKSKIDDVVRNIITQIVALHGYDDLKLVFFIDEYSEDWEFVKGFPHIWDNSRQLRFWADNIDDMNEIALYLEDELKNRQSNKNECEKTPYYLIITNNYQKMEEFKFTRELLKCDENLGFSLLCVGNDLYNLPNKCTTFIVIENDEGILFSNENSEESEKRFVLENSKALQFSEMSSQLFSKNLRINGKNISHLPTSYNFLEMYKSGTIEKLNILERWKKNDSTLSLKAPIGIDGNGTIVYLDIHEKYHGPHGLIAGSTGSGKSEFIITYILSLAVNYHPDDLKFLLIDYKGGGLAGAFERNGMRLPHIVGKITNIDKNGLKRSMISIESELKRRQVMFNQAREMTNEGTIDIYKYQRLYHEGAIKEPIPHLLIVCDEFAELKQQQGDFMDELISVSRIGRSLGVHLILATQKPSGVVNDQIRSNSKFAVCLKVQDTSDSMDVIKKQDAAFLKNTGQFYLQVGNDDFFVLGQSAWSGASYIPSEKVEESVDTSIEFISRIGNTIKRVDGNIEQTDNSQGEQLTNIVKYICELSKQENIKQSNLWLSELPEDIYISDLRKKYDIVEKENDIKVLIGEYDDPSKQEQGFVQIDLNGKNNIAILGNEKSGKETFLSTMIYEVITNYSSSKVQLYILDFGTEALKIYKNSSHVGEVVFVSEDEKVGNFFKMIEQEIKERKEILSNHNGDYDLYISKGNVMPLWTIIINNYEAFEENYGTKYADTMLTLSRDGLKCGMLFIVTASAITGMRYRLRQNFEKKIALQLNGEDDYYSVFERRVDTKPSSIFGRGILILNEGELVEFQTAKICKHIDYNTHIENIINKMNEKNILQAKSIVSLPDVLKVEDVKESLTDINHVPIGISKSDLSVCTYDFKENFLTLVVSNNMSKPIEFSNAILEEIKILKNINSMVLDPEEIRAQGNSLKDGFAKFFDEIKNNIKTKEKEFTLCVIIGIDKFLSNGIIDKSELKELLDISKKSEMYSFIIIDNPNHLKSYSYDEWYEYIDKESGIWIGNGVTSQKIIKVNLGMFSPEGKCGSSFGVLIKEKDTTLIKLLGIEPDEARII